ncbi:MAG: hypothetical protein HGA77_04950 [Chlorobiaceae bacterium]|nr:hypothetical protein [Chlorobiaceae bacterium]
MLKAIDMTKALAWIAARWKEPSTKRSIWLVGTGIIAIVYAIINREPSSAIVGAGTTIYGLLNASTPERGSNE